MKKLLNPFETYSEKQLLFFGLIGSLVGVVVAYLFNARFDGILDIHFDETVTWKEVIVDNLINVLVLSVLLFATGKIINPKTRFVDLFNASLICRIPYYFMPVFNSNNYMFQTGEEIMSAIQKGNFNEISTMSVISNSIFTIFAVLAIISLIFLLWNGFKIATNAKGKKPIILFVTGLLLTEILSKNLINYLLIQL
jgi:hypothetical protein